MNCSECGYELKFQSVDEVDYSDGERILSGKVHICLNCGNVDGVRDPSEKEISPIPDKCYISNGALEQNTMSEKKVKSDNVGGSAI